MHKNEDKNIERSEEEEDVYEINSRIAIRLEVRIGIWNVREHSAGGSYITSDMQEFIDCINMIKVEDLRLKYHLRKLNWQNGNLFDKVEKLRNEVKKVQVSIDNDHHNKALREIEVQLLKDYMIVMEDEERLLYQKSKINCCDVQDINDLDLLVSKRISEDEVSAFVAGRHIQDNVLLTQELLKGYDRKRGPKRVSFKIDTHKAYDTMNWSFTINVNGEHCGFVKGGRGLRQGDPMSPYLFTLVMECFTLMMEKNVKRNPSFQYHFSCTIMELTHVCFADDLLVFCHGDVESTKVIRNSIEEFALMPFEKGKLLMKYLGVPLITKRLGIKNCKFLADKVRSKVSNCKNKSLLYASRLKLIASVLESILVYWCFVFLLPKVVIKEINSILMVFLWCNGKLTKGKAKVAWNKIYKLRSHGGLGHKDLDVWSKALLVPILNAEKNDWIVWKNNDGRESKFSLKDVYNDMREMSIEEKLMTYDIMIKWGNYDMTCCLLCKNNAETHDHPFFICPFSAAIWKELKVKMRLCLATAVYSIWRESNNRILRDECNNLKDVLIRICEIVRLKIMSMQVKDSEAVNQVSKQWNVALNVRKRGLDGRQ
ncbi:RNA-directed DNA polymerase, eukaryota, reverse transcriptase zinc-binding domain protein [Tanacetum coccineum]